MKTDYWEFNYAGDVLGISAVDDMKRVHAQKENSILETMVIEPFETALKEKLVWTDRRRPKEGTTDERKWALGNIEVKLSTRATTKTPGYSLTHAHLYAFVENIIEETEVEDEKIKRDKVRRIDGEPHIEIEYLLDCLDRWTTKEKGIEQTVEYSGDVFIEDKMHLNLSRDYSEINKETAGAYALAKEWMHRNSEDIILKFSKEAKKVAEETKEKILDMPEWLMIISKTEPLRTKWGKLIDTLTCLGDSKKKLGELDRLYVEENTPELKELRELYCYHKIEGKSYVGAVNLRERLNELYRDPKISKKSPSLSFEYFPKKLIPKI